MRKNTHTKSNKNLTTIVNFVLDKSGSMLICEQGTIKGFNQYLSQLKEKGGRVLFSLTLFDDVVTKRYSLMPIAEVEKLTNENYNPSGSTALWDAAVSATEEAYERAKELREDKPVCITVILTDGEENASKEHDRECLTDLIKQLEGEGNWTFVYLGANQDAWTNANSMGVSYGNSSNFRSDNAGMMKSMSALACATVSLMDDAAQGKGMNSVNFLASVKDDKNFIK